MADDVDALGEIGARLRRVEAFWHDAEAECRATQERLDEAIRRNEAMESTIKSIAVWFRKGPGNRSDYRDVGAWYAHCWYHKVIGGTLRDAGHISLLDSTEGDAYLLESKARELREGNA